MRKTTIIFEVYGDCTKVLETVTALPAFPDFPSVNINVAGVNVVQGVGDVVDCSWIKVPFQGEEQMVKFSVSSKPESKISTTNPYDKVPFTGEDINL